MGQPVMHWQIVTKNPDALTKFYATLFDWKVHDDNPMRYRMIDTGAARGINGGVWPAPPDAHGFVQLFVEVDDAAAYVRKAVDQGARVIIPPQKLPDGGQLAVLHDPEGIPFGLMQPA
jgi:hypothetical protein